MHNLGMPKCTICVENTEKAKKRSRQGYKRHQQALTSAERHRNNRRRVRRIDFRRSRRVEVRQRREDPLLPFGSNLGRRACSVIVDGGKILRCLSFLLILVLPPISDAQKSSISIFGKKPHFPPCRRKIEKKIQQSFEK